MPRSDWLIAIRSLAPSPTIPTLLNLRPNSLRLQCCTIYLLFIFSIYYSTIFFFDYGVARAKMVQLLLLTNYGFDFINFRSTARCSSVQILWFTFAIYFYSSTSWLLAYLMMTALMQPFYYILLPQSTITLWFSGISLIVRAAFTATNILSPVIILHYISAFFNVCIVEIASLLIGFINTATPIKLLLYKYWSLSIFI